MIYVVKAEGREEEITSSLKKAIALAYCLVGRSDDAKDEKPFLLKVRAIKREMKDAGNTFVIQSDGSDPLDCREARVYEADIKGVSKTLAEEFGIIYGGD